MTDSPYQVDLTEENFGEVLQRSQQTPVLLDFWATWCEPCQALAPVLEKLARDYQGRFILAKVDADAQPAIVQQLAVRSLPTLKLVVNGALAGELMGGCSESEIKQLLDAHIEELPEGGDNDAVDNVLQVVGEARATGAYDQARDVLNEAIQGDPENLDYQTLLAEVFLDEGRLKDARTVIDNIADAARTAGVKARMGFMDIIAEGPQLAQLQKTLVDDPGHVESLYYMAHHLIVDSCHEEGMDLFLSVMQRDRDYRDDGGRKALLAVFDILGSDNPLVTAYRRKMFAVMH